MKKTLLLTALFLSGCYAELYTPEIKYVEKTCAAACVSFGGYIRIGIGADISSGLFNCQCADGSWKGNFLLRDMNRVPNED